MSAAFTLKEADEMLTDSLAPRVLPAGWKRTEDPGPGCAAFWSQTGLYVLFSATMEKDEKHWLHVSVSRRNRLPTYDDLVRVKDIFVGTERTALQVFPPRGQHINIHPYCLHLWCCLDADVVPDFRYLDPNQPGMVGI